VKSRSPSHQAQRETCPRCGSPLPGRVTHDSESDCVDTLVARCRISELARRTIRKQLDNASARLESWKVKARMREQTSLSPGVIVTGNRLAALEARADAAERRDKSNSDRLAQLEQRITFLMTEIQKKPADSVGSTDGELRRAS
jgi:hypothetical protein